MSDDKLNNVDKRLGVAENEQANIKESLTEIKNRTEESHKVIYEIKERLDKQNGLIPHISEDVKKVIDNLESHVGVFAAHSIEFRKHVADDEKAYKNIDDIKAEQLRIKSKVEQDLKESRETSFKIKIIWGAIGVVSGSALYALVKLLLGNL